MITVLTLGFSFYPLHCVRPKRESPPLLNYLTEATPEDREDELMTFSKKRGINVEKIENLRSEKEDGYPGVRNRYLVIGAW
jgi:hypothetical protein